MRVIIIGDGLAGRIAHHGLKSMLGLADGDSLEVFDARKEDDITENHHAVLRIRDPNTALYLGADIEKIEVTKGIFWNGEILNEASILHNNLYSLKLGNSLQNKSINNLGACTRYLLRSVSALDKVHRGKVFEGFTDVGEAVFSDRDTKDLAQIKYDAIISTIPMPVMLDKAKIDFDIRFDTQPIFVYKGYLNIDSHVHQTLYFPDPSMSTYRATIQGNRFILESTAQITKELTFIFQSAFGLNEGDIMMEEDQPKIQQNGKMILIDDDIRKQFITQLTDKYKVFSFGRFATWKPLRTDHLIPDIELIKKMLKSKYVVNKKRAGAGNNIL